MAVGNWVGLRVGRNVRKPNGTSVPAPEDAPGGHLPNWLPALCAALVILPAGLIAVLGTFDGLYGQDAFAYYGYAVGPLRESILRFAAPPPFFWPPGYPLLVALVSLVIGPSPLAGQIVSLTAAGLVPVFTALLARELWCAVYPSASGRSSKSQWVVFVAGIATALTPQLWQSGIVIMADTTGLAAATLGYWALARYGRTRQPAWLLLAAAGLAYATLTRWIYGLVALPAAVCALWVAGRSAGRVGFRHLVPAAVVAGVILLPLAIPLLTRIIDGSNDAAAFAGTLHVYNWDTWQPANFWQNEFATSGHGSFQYGLPNGLYYAFLPAHRYLLGPLLALFLLAGLLRLIANRTVPVLLLAGGWVAVVYLFHAGATWQNLRYGLAYLPPLAIVAAWGAVSLVRSSHRWTQWTALSLLIAGFALQAFFGVGLTSDFVARKADHLAIANWVTAEVPSAAPLLTFGLTLTLRHYTPLDVLELWELTPADLSTLTRSDRPVYLLLDVSGVERQWQGHAPFANYVWLRDGPGLTPLGERGGFTLFRVGSAAR